MSAWIVYSKDGLTERCELHAVEYGGTHMGERAVTATFESDSKVDFDIFDYLSYRGEVFELESAPTVKKTSSFEYSYELRFVSRKYELERCEMRDLVPSDNGVVYPTPLSFSFTGDVRYLTDRIQACLDDLYGEGVWNIVIADGVESEEKNITIAQQNCWNALALVNSTYGLDFYIKGRVITIGGSQPVVSHVFEYGKGNGLYEIERAANTDTAIVTKLRAYGSDRNLDYSYPKKPEWSDSNLPVSFAFSPLRLMLPSFKVDKTDYVLADEETIKKYGIREASIVYEDIYPSITGATHNGRAIDEIKAVEAVDDNASTFVVHLHDLGFDLEAHLITADAQISMKSGAMQGYTFTISNIEKQEDNSYKITLGRVSAEGGENYNIPNSDWNMREGDKFVLLNILMPQKYIREAENRLKQRAEEYLAQYSKTNFGYNIGLHDKFLIENPSIYDALIEGSKLSVYDEELGISEDVTIQSITITENAADNTLPQVKVTLNNEPSASTLDRIQGKIDSLANESAANNFATQSEIMAQYRKKLDKPFFDKLFAAVDAEGNEIPSTDTVTPVAYIKARYDFAVVGGVTMYLNDGSLDLPNIFEGIPFDNKTIWLNPETKLVEVIGSTEEDECGSADFNNVKESGGGNSFTSFILSEDGKELTFVKGETFTKQSDFAALNTKVADFLEGSDTDDIINKWKELEAFLSGMKESDDLATILATKWTKDDAKIANWDDAFGWGDHSKVGYAKATDVAEELKKYVTLSGTQTITGEKDFTGGLKVNGQPIVYDARGFWKLDGDLIVTGGITMYANEGQYTPSTITDAVNIDDDTLIRVNGVIMLNPDIEIGGGTDIDLSEYAKKATTLSGYGITDAYTKSAVDGFLEDKADVATTLAGYGITNAYTKTQVDGLLEGFITSDDVEVLLEDYLLLTGGTITGNLRLRVGTENTSPYLYFGDSNEVWLKEVTDTHLTIHADGSVKIDSPKTIIDGIEIKKSASGVLFIDANLVVSGGITMYGTDGTTANTIWDDAPIASTSVKGVASFDSEFFAVNNGKVTFIGSTGGGGIESITKQMVIDALGFTPYDEDNPNGFITSSGTSNKANSLTTARTISLTGQATGSTTFDGSTNKSIAVTIPTRSVRFNGEEYTVLTNSDTTSDMPNIYAADYAGTANQVLVSGGSGNAPSWVNQSSITSGACSGNAATATTASKLSTTSKTAWGQTYWTSGGVPTSIDGNMSNVGHIALKSHNAYDIGTDSVGVRYIYANWIGGVSGGNFSIGANDSTAITILTDKSVGIGTTNPKSKLHVAGSVQADNTFLLTSNDNGSGVYGFFQGGKLLLRKDGSGNTILSADSGGIYLRPNGSIYATAQSVIDTSGNLLVAGGVTMYSDLRKKTILNHVELSLKEVADAPLIEHYYNSDEKKTTHVGSVAQYWAELNDWFCKEDEEGFLTMEIQNAALASAISVARELTRYESKTDKQIKKLKKRIGELEEEIENLKKV